MNEPHSRNVTYLILDDNGTVTVLDPLEDPDAGVTPQERQALLNYLEKTRNLYRRRPTISPEAPPAPQ